jgi:hypothetical protein
MVLSNNTFERTSLQAARFALGLRAAQLGR